MTSHSSNDSSVVVVEQEPEQEPVEVDLEIQEAPKGHKLHNEGETNPSISGVKRKLVTR